jgi:hypothetical protein
MNMWTGGDGVGIWERIRARYAIVPAKITRLLKLVSWCHYHQTAGKEDPPQELALSLTSCSVSKWKVLAFGSVTMNV